MKKKNIPPHLEFERQYNSLKSLLTVNGFYSANSIMNPIFEVIEKLVYWAAIIESSDDAIMGMSTEGTITSWNKGAERLYGYTIDEVLGKHISLLMPPKKKDDFPKVLKWIRGGKKVEHYETKRMTKNGKVIDVSLTVSPIRNSKGTIIGASKVARDITERIENEKRREEFISTTSHELKTPLTSQKIFGEVLEQLIERDGNTQYIPYIQKINLQTAKLTKLVDDLLEMSRIRTGRMKMEQELFDLESLIEEVISSMQKTTKHKIIVNGTINKKIIGDRERIGQVITNLLSNAFKYSPKANKVIITTGNKSNFVTVSIQDFGIGIPKEYQQNIFERFFRVTGPDEKTFPGMGIGLHLCQEIVSRHGGEIWVESKKGKGSKFTFSLPLPNNKA